MRESDWSRANLLRSDWLPTSVAMITTFVIFHYYLPMILISLFLVRILNLKPL